MAGEDDRAVARAIGKIEGTIAGFQATIEHLTKSWAIQDERATEGRRQLHVQVGALTREVAELAGEIKPVADLRREVTTLSKKFEPLAATVERIEPIVTKLDRTYTQGSAIGMLVKAAWMAAAGVLGGLLVKYGPG